MPFETFINKNQIQKVGMPDTLRSGFSDFYDVVNHSARGYTYFRNGSLTNVYEVFLSNLRTAAGIYSTASEIGEWLIALQNK